MSRADFAYAHLHVWSFTLKLKLWVELEQLQRKALVIAETLKSTWTDLGTYNSREN